MFLLFAVYRITRFLTVDADTGFGGSINVARTVRMYERAGIAALHIEDQGIRSHYLLSVVGTKRCGHLLGKAVISREDFATRLRAAVQALSDKPSRPIIIARYYRHWQR